MTNFSIQAAGLTVGVTALFESTRDYCREFLSEEAPCLSVAVTSEDIAFERAQTEREYALEGRSPRNFTDAALEVTALQRKTAERLFAYDTLVFHGSCIAVDGVGYLFTAKSGTGKSTHTRLWREAFGDRAVMINDDKPFLKIGETFVMVCGSPWKGKHSLGCNLSVPLKSICILERGEENRIGRIAPAAAVKMLFQQSNRPRDPRMMVKYMELIDRLAQNVALYRMQCNMDPEAALISYREMSG